MNSRQLILRIMTAYDKRPGNPERLIDHALGGLHIDHRDRRLIFEIVYGIVRRRATLDYLIDRHVTDEKNRDDHLLRRILRIGLYQLLYLDRIPDHAAVNETVELAKAGERSKNFAGTINAVMRTLIKNKKQIEYPDPQKDLAGRLAVEFSHPKWMVERWLRHFGLANTRGLLTYNNEKPPVFLRRSLRKMTRRQFEADVRLICDTAGGYRDLYYRLKKALLPENIQLIRQGFCNVQAPSSGWVAALLDVKQGDRIIDICSAPGGKSALMAEMAGDSGMVCACEVSFKRLRMVVEIINAMNLWNIHPLVCDGALPPFRGIFDKVLLDAPCTATGVLHRHPEARWIRTAHDITRLAKVQAMLLDAAATLVGGGGSIVYATCSLEPEENEQQIERFLADHPQFELDSCPEAVPQKFIDNRGFLSITPYEHHMDGMFAARLRRAGDYAAPSYDTGAGI
ncbi:MAG: 16S rRNA (cytosine(967)-C(5))-methyltransferase RsmB [Chitinispirillaceae bacterium]|nr:16S rRNA (cytosine(967)-C(5))-methyltransferase RsmB [Chitinispirillaceae bacterium]